MSASKRGKPRRMRLTGDLEEIAAATPHPPELRAAAARYVASRAADAADARLLLSALGLLDVEVSA